MTKLKQWWVLFQLIKNPQTREQLRRMTTLFISYTTEKDLNYLNRPANAGATKGPYTQFIVLAQQIEKALERLNS